MRAGAGLLAGLVLQDAWGLALGPASVQSAIGEPLRVAIELPALSNDEAETLQASIAAPEAFQAAALEYAPLLAELKIELERAPGGQARLKLQGRQVVDEAWLDLLLQLNWKGGQLTRRYSLLLSPAGMPLPESQLEAYPIALAQTPIGIALPARSPAQPDTGARRPGAADPSGRRVPAAATAEPAASLPATPAAPPGATATATVPAPAAEVAEAAALPADPAEPAEPATATPETTPAAVTAPPAAVPAAPTAPAAASWSDRLRQAVWLGAAALLAGLAGLLAWRRRQAPEQLVRDAGSLVQAAAAQEPVVAPAAPAAAAAQPPETGGEIDPIAEAEVYLAYGRVQQAEEILHDALRHHPDSVALHLKLLELAAQRGDRPACMPVLAAITALTGNAGPDQERAQQLLDRLAPEPPASSKVQPAGFPVTPAMTPTDTASANPEAFDLDLPALPEQAPALQTDNADEDRGLDFDIDLSELGLSGTPAQPETGDTQPAASAAAREQGTMPDFELEIPSDALSDLLVKEDNRDPDPLATQMELAEEFLALGDAEGARPLAERVQALATGELQSRARALLQQLDARPH